MNDMSGNPDGYDGENDPLTGTIIGCAINIHKVLGPGFLENIYNKALAHELAKAGIKHLSESRLQVLYDGIVLGD